MPTKKRAKKQPAAAPAPAEAVAKNRKRRRRHKPVAEPVPVVAEVKSAMHRILEGQREQLNQLNDDLQKVIFLGW